MMSKKSLLSTKSSPKTESYLLSKMSSLLEQSIPNDISGMLALAKYTENAIVFYDRYHLKTVEPSDYLIYDSVLGYNIYENIALFASAVHIIYNVKKNKVNSSHVDKQIYTQDQKYFRCIQNIKFYKHALKTAKDEREAILANRLENDLVRLHEIKNELFKIF